MTNSTTYLQKLKDPRWQKKRLQASEIQRYLLDIYLKGGKNAN